MVIYFWVMHRGFNRWSAIAPAALLAAVALAAPAAADNTTTTPVPALTTSRTTPRPAPKPPARVSSVRLYLPDVFFVNQDPVTVPGRFLHIGGVVRPYVPGQYVTVRAFIGHHLLKSARVRLKRSRNGRYGHFTMGLMSRRVGDVFVYVQHAPTPQLRGFRARRGFSVLNTNVGFGSIGRFVELLQQRLAALHFYIPQTGVYDDGTGLAIDAYHRLLNWGTYQDLDGATVSWLLDGFGAFKVHFPGNGRHAEANLSLQLLALLDGGHIEAIYPISSGKDSTPTVLGDFQVYEKDPGYNSEGMYYSNYFYGGYAIHGYDPAPDYPASHGCLRLPIDDAISVYDWLDYNDWVDVYY